MAAEVDRGAVEALASRLRDVFVDASIAYMVDLGHRTGLLDALAAGPATSAELAGRAGLHERHVREWLGSMATSGLSAYDPDTARHTMSPEATALLSGSGPLNMAPFAAMVTSLAQHVPAVAETFRDGGGLPYAVYRPEFTSVMDAVNRRRYEALLVDAYLPLCDGLPESLNAGARVIDIGCGTGHTTNLMAAAHPASHFVGVDLATDAIERARAEAGVRGLDNVEFRVADIAELDTDPGADVVVAFDVIHDQVDPAGVLARIAEALVPGGRFCCVDIDARSDLADNLGDPRAPLLYALSTLHCMQVSLAHDGAGLGTAWGRELAVAMFGDAGFTSVDIHRLPGDSFNVLYDCRTD